MIELFGAIATVLAVAGVLLNNRRRINCFYLWLISNAICAVLHACTGLWSLCIRDVIFFVLAIEGIYRWRTKPQTPRDNYITIKQFFRERNNNETAKQKKKA